MYQKCSAPHPVVAVRPLVSAMSPQHCPNRRPNKLSSSPCNRLEGGPPAFGAAGPASKEARPRPTSTGSSPAERCRTSLHPYWFHHISCGAHTHTRSTHCCCCHQERILPGCVSLGVSTACLTSRHTREAPLLMTTAATTTHTTNTSTRLASSQRYVEGGRHRQTNLHAWQRFC